MSDSTAAAASTTGFRIASVGVATFAVSFVAALWLLLVCAAGFLRRPWLAIAASAALAATVAVFAAGPRESAASVAASSLTVRFVWRGAWAIVSRVASRRGALALCGYALR